MKKLRPKSFDEIRDEKGRVRKHYRKAYSCWSSLSETEKVEIRSFSKLLFSGDYPVDPLPRIIRRDEFSQLLNGVEQRATAILSFLCDYYSGEKRWNKILPRHTLQIILGRDGTRSVFGKLDPDTISFPYGPDIIRDSNGEWRVVEDSAGCLGGLGDILESRKILRTIMPAYAPLLRTTVNPMRFYERLACYFNAKARKKKGIALLYLQDFENESDNETRRLAETFTSLGIETVTDGGMKKRIIVDDKAVYLQSRGKRERIGYLILHVGPEDLDYRRLLIGVKKYLDRHGEKTLGSFPELNDFYSIRRAILENKVSTNFSPGTQFVNDKMFGLFVDRLVRSYLKQEPILKSIPGQSFAYRSRSGRWTLDTALLKKVLRGKNDFVVKQVDEDGGAGVWIGLKQTRKEFENLRPRISKTPERYIAQKYTPLSTLENRIVDLRLHAQVSVDEIIVNNTPWGRANWVDGDGKVNVGQGGFISPVLVR